MEIEITDLIEAFETYEIAPERYADSVYNSGLSNIGVVTWNNAMEDAEEDPILTTEEQLEAARDLFREYGAWSTEEIDGWTAQEINALLLQDIACRYQDEDSEDIYTTDDGQAFFWLG